MWSVQTRRPDPVLSLQSLVLENVYKEAFTMELLYEHVFSLVSEDGSSFQTKHRMLKVLESPLICRVPFSLNSELSNWLKL